jgi:alcohol dehydrogenase YqhD (iron-dependent ADH family)
MDDFSFPGPTFFKVGKGTEFKVGELVTSNGGKKILLHYGRESAEKSGLLGKVRKSLEDSSIKYIELGGVQANPRSDLVYKGIEIVKKEGIDFILAVGGGSVIDSAKAIAGGAKYSGDFFELFSGKASWKDALPVGVVLTISATGSEASPNTIISFEDGKLKIGSGSDLLRPKFAIVNPELATTLSPYQIACGGAGIMVYLFERYLTNTKRVGTTDRLIEGLLSYIIRELPSVMANPKDYNAHSGIMWAGTLAHNNICGAGGEQDWASYQIEHELSALYDVEYGAGLAVIFPAWMKYVFDHDVMRFSQLFKKIFGIQIDSEAPENATLEGIENLIEFWRSIGLPTNFEGLGAKEEDIPYMASHIRNGGCGSFVRLNTKDIENIYRLAL